MSQFALSMPLSPAYETQQFMEAACNQHALAWIKRWPDWPMHGVYLHAEPGAGKTHLAHIWQRQSNAEFVASDSEAMPLGAMIIDGVEDWQNANALFHLLNHAMLNKQPVLITSSVHPDGLTITLPDVISRLKALPMASIDAPDDMILHAVLLKQLADLQLKISPEVVAYLLPRLPRSFASLRALVNKLDHASLSAARTLTIPFIRDIMGW